MKLPIEMEDFHQITPGAAPVSLGGLLAVLVFGAVCLGFHWLGRDGWVPLLDSANLALHEAGHPLVGIFSARATVYGGTLFQLVFPLAAAWHFRRAGNPVGLALHVGGYGLTMGQLLSLPMIVAGLWFVLRARET